MTRLVQELKENWLFCRNDCEDGEKTGIDDATWETVNVPHDWAIKGPFDEMNDIQITQIKEDGETKEYRHNGRSRQRPEKRQCQIRQCYHRQ